MAAVDEREAETGPFGSRAPQLLPDPSARARARRRRGGERHAVQVQQQRPPAGHAGERGGDPLDPSAVHHRAGEDVLGVDGTLEHVVLLGEQPREHRLGDRDEGHRIRHLEHREPRSLGRGDQRARDLLVTEPEPEPEARQAGVVEPLRRRPAASRASCRCPCPVVSRSSPPFSHGVGSSSSLLWTQRTGAIRARLPGHQAQCQARDAQDVADGQRPRPAIVRVVQTKDDLGPGACETGRVVQSPGPRLVAPKT